MEYWLCVAEVKAGQENLVAYFCSHKCLKAWAKESEGRWLSRTTQQQEERNWYFEEILVRHNLLDKVQRHDDMNTCPLCGQTYVEDEDCVFFRGILIHSHCIDRIKKKKEVYKKDELGG